MPRDVDLLTWNRGRVRERWALAENQTLLPCCAHRVRVERHSNLPQRRVCPHCGELWEILAVDCAGGRPPAAAVLEGPYALSSAGHGAQGRLFAA